MYHAFIINTGGEISLPMYAAISESEFHNATDQLEQSATNHGQLLI